MKTERNQVFKCEHCGNVVEVLHGGGPVMVCCDHEMVLLEENTVDAAQEKHVPIVSKGDGGFKVAVGEVAHPMEEKHFIEFIELIADGISYRKFLDPGDKPEAFFAVDAGQATARAYCNLHGLWKS